MKTTKTLTGKIKRVLALAIILVPLTASSFDQIAFITNNLFLKKPSEMFYFSANNLAEKNSIENWMFDLDQWYSNTNSGSFS